MMMTVGADEKKMVLKNTAKKKLMGTVSRSTFLERWMVNLETENWQAKPPVTRNGFTHLIH